MTPGDIGSLDAARTLAAVEERTMARRAGELVDMRLALKWCDLHSIDPQTQPGAVSKSKGGDYLRGLGGEGTPGVSDLCWEELGIARCVGDAATRNYCADVLDLAYRMPLLWSALEELHLDAWLARKIARMARKLSAERVRVVDAAVHAKRFLPQGRLLALAEAKIIEADPDLHRTLLAEDAKKTGVWLSRPKTGESVDEVTGEPGTRRVSAKLPAGTALRCEETIEDLAEAIFDHTETDAEGNRPSRDECRVQAFEMLVTDPAQAAAFLATLDTDPSHEPIDPEQAVELAGPKRKPRAATLHVHLTDGVLLGRAQGVARVEELGPVLLDQLADLLGDRHITLQPVIDLNTVAAVNGYEHPTAMKHRTLLRTSGDVFPHSASHGTRRLDYDHPVPYQPDGPPGQTSDRNCAPLTRHHHRAKTHLPYQCHQLALATYRWITPHGLARIVTPTGTRTIEILYDEASKPRGEIYTGPPIHPPGRE